MDSTGTTNYQLAKAIGCHQTTVANILSGSNPQARTKQAIANYFNVSVSFLTGETDDPTEQPAATKEGQKKPAAESDERPKLRSVARLESADITPEMDKHIAAYIEFLLKNKE